MAHQRGRFAAILAAILIATLLSRRWPLNPKFSLTVVVGALILLVLVPLRGVAPTGGVGKILFAILACGIPVAFAGFAFASRFAARTNTHVAFGWNIIGAVLGGLLELLSMIAGLKAMFLLGALIYASLLLAQVRRTKRVESPLGGEVAAAAGLSVAREA